MSAGALDPSRPHVHVVANRLPVTWSPSAGWGRAPGGLVTALESYVRRHPVTWIGSSASLGNASGPSPTWPHGPVRQVPIEPALAAAAVNGMSNCCLWPALHGMNDRVRWREEWWDAYRVHNERFSEAVASTAAHGDLVWIHDYQLLLVAELLAEARPDLVVGLSLHTPIDAAALTDLPVASALTDALQAPRLVGVQTRADQEAISACCDRRRGGTVVSPVSIDPVELTALGHDRATLMLTERIRSRLGTRSLLVGIDRIDHTKGILQRLDAIDRSFRLGRVTPDDVEIVQIAQPSRTGLSTYRDLSLAIERRAHDVASNWLRSDGTQALRTITEGRDRRQVAALLAAADVALVTPVRDGMNLVAKEFSILNEARAGVLVLSEGAGAAAELGSASVLVDGADPTSVAAGIARAVSLDVPARRDMARRRADVTRAWTSEHWAADFEGRLRASVRFCDELGEDDNETETTDG
jgi:trehalose 6-phosphate synthase